MEQPNDPTGNARQPARPSAVLWLYPILLVLAIGLLAWGVAIYARDRASQVLLAAGAVSVIGVLLGWSHAINLRALQREQRTLDEATFGPVNERLQHISVLLNQVSEQQLISERAKSIAYRENDRDALRRAIREEMARHDWDAALMLINEIETSFGYKQEADRFREEINNHRAADIRRHVGEAAATIERLCHEEKWTQAVREAERVLRLFPNDPQAQNLPQEIEARRMAFKRGLREAFDEAVARHDVDAGVDLLRKLDFYLTPAEAQAMQDQARALFRDKLQQLGQQFTTAVREHRWHDALQLGALITHDFPNTRMAQEVRDRWEVLHQRAGENHEEPEPADVHVHF